MEGSFALALIACAAFLYGPGYLLLRGCRFGRVLAAGCAPLAMLCLYGVLAIAYGRLGVPASWGLLLAPPLVLATFLWGLAVARQRRCRVELGREEARRRAASAARADGCAIALYGALGVAIGASVFLASIGSPGAFMQDFDNIHHLNSVRGFLDSGNWSSLGVTYYPLEGDAALRPFPDASFYPSAWHGVVAMVADATGASLPVAVNATLFVFAFVAFPLAMLSLVQALFDELPRAVVLLGACCVVLFAAFPGGFLKFGPLYPNLAAFAVMPAAVACFLRAFDARLGRSRRVACGLLCAVGIVGLALTQPNAVFSAAVFLVPFCAGKAMGLAPRVKILQDRPAVAKGLLCAGFLLCALAVWTALFEAPFMQSVVTHAWGSFTGVTQALVDAATLGYRGVMAQPILAALVAVGAAYALCHGRYRWLVCSYGLVVVMYVAVARVDGFLRFFLTGFWYTDPYRIAAMAELFAMPLAVLGLWCAARGVRWLLGRLAAGTDVAGAVARWSFPLVGALLVVLGSWPSFEVHGWLSVQTGLGAIREELAAKYATDSARVYDDAERAFVEEALAALPDGAVLANDPNDGSTYAYSVDGARVLYRNATGYGGDDETAASRAIREGLDRVADDEGVREALRETGVRYVLLLDQGPTQGQQPHLWTYAPEEWPGLNGVGDDTPGFEVVLARDDMRLYRITVLDEAA